MIIKSRAAAVKVKTMLCVFLNHELATVCVPWYMCLCVHVLRWNIHVDFVNFLHI